MQVDLLKQLIN